MIYALDHDRADRDRPALDRRRARGRGRRPGDVARGRRRGGRPRPPGRAALRRRAASCVDLRAASAGASTATSRSLRAEVAGRPLSQHRVPGRARRGSGRRCTARPPATCCCRPRPATSSSTGAAPTTSAAARTAPCTAPTRSGRCCGAAPARTSRDAREQWSLRDITPMVREHFGLAIRQIRPIRTRLTEDRSHVEHDKRPIHWRRCPRS